MYYNKYSNISFEWYLRATLGEFELNVVHFSSLSTIFIHTVLVPDLEMLLSRCCIRFLWMLKYIFSIHKSYKQIWDVLYSVALSYVVNSNVFSYVIVWILCWRSTWFCPVLSVSVFLYYTGSAWCSPGQNRPLRKTTCREQWDYCQYQGLCN